MKTITIILAVSFFVTPSISFAAALTSQQSSSLIAVVQSSPGTPASAFVSLITAFSNITVNQAASLITVVQAAPGVPASAFVNLLTSFTVDTPSTSATNQAVTPTEVSSSNSTKLSLSLGQVTVTTNSVHLSWTTNLPATSKVFLSKTAQETNATSPQVITSVAGISTQGFVDIPDLSSNTMYSYTLEAIYGSQVQKISGTFTTNSIPVATVSVSNAGSSTSINSVGASNVRLASFKISVTGEDVIVTNLNISAVTSNGAGLKNGSIWIGGGMVSSRKDLPNGEDVNFTSNFVLKAGTESTIDIDADVKGTNNIDLPNGTTITISLGVGSQNAQGQSSLKSINVPSSGIIGSTVTIAAPTVTVAKYSGYGNQTISAGSQHVKIGSFMLSAQGDGVNLNTIDIGFLSDVSSKLFNLVIWDSSTGQIGTTKATIAATNQYSVNVTIPSYSPKTFNIYADVRADASPGPITAIVKSDTSGTTVSGGNGVSVGSDVPLQTITIQ